MVSEPSNIDLLLQARVYQHEDVRVYRYSIHCSVFHSSIQVLKACRNNPWCVVNDSCSVA